MTAQLDVVNPRTGAADYTIAPLSADQLADLATRMRAAQPVWAARTAEERGEILGRFAQAIRQHREPLVAALTADTGRAGISRTEADTIPHLLARWAGSAPAIIARSAVTGFQTSHPTIDTDLRLVPYPLVGVISPWNFPLILALIDAIPALMAGCAVLVKPSEVTPRFIRPDTPLRKLWFRANRQQSINLLPGVRFYQLIGESTHLLMADNAKSQNFGWQA